MGGSRAKGLTAERGFLYVTAGQCVFSKHRSSEIASPPAPELIRIGKETPHCLRSSLPNGCLIPRFDTLLTRLWMGKRIKKQARYEATANLARVQGTCVPKVSHCQDDIPIIINTGTA